MSLFATAALMTSVGVKQAALPHQTLYIFTAFFVVNFFLMAFTYGHSLGEELYRCTQRRATDVGDSATNTTKKADEGTKEATRKKKDPLGRSKKTENKDKKRDKKSTSEEKDGERRKTAQAKGMSKGGRAISKDKKPRSKLTSEEQTSNLEERDSRSKKQRPVDKDEESQVTTSRTKKTSNANVALNLGRSDTATASTETTQSVPEEEANKGRSDTVTRRSDSLRPAARSTNLAVVVAENITTRGGTRTELGTDTKRTGPRKFFSSKEARATVLKVSLSVIRLSFALVMAGVLIFYIRSRDQHAFS